MTNPKQDGTMELDVGQIDLLDLPLPPRSAPSIAEGAGASAEPRVSKGPPPLPPMTPSAPPVDLGPLEPPATAAPTLTLPPPPTPTPPPPSSGAASSHPAISARRLVDGPAPAPGGQALRILVGLGAAALVGVGCVFLFRALHKSPHVQTVASAQPPASATIAAPIHSFTMAPIEFTADESPSASAAVSSAVPATTRGATTTTTTAKPNTAGGGTAKPRSDDVIKVEN